MTMRDSPCASISAWRITSGDSSQPNSSVAFPHAGQLSDTVQ
ncbi:hypothetical protein [Micromonospora sp. NPDC049282]